MGLFDFFKKKKDEPKMVVSAKPVRTSSARPVAPKPTPSVSTTSNLFSKSELENLIRILSKISYIFRDCELLVGGRNQTMMSRTHSYAGILGYLYEVDYEYGKMKDIVDSEIASHYVLVMLSMSDTSHKKKTINELADNWSDVLQVIFNLQLETNITGNKLKAMDSDIKKVTSAFEKLSGKKCKAPKNPFNMAPRQVTYNPYRITEDPTRSRGHAIPDITNVFAQELIPQILSAKSSGVALKDVVANYAIGMIKSYYDNAGFVPMVIVDQITGQINQVAEMAARISYAPQASLKEYILSKIYK